MFAKAKAEAAKKKAEFDAKAAEIDKKHGLSDKAAEKKAQAEAKAAELDQKHNIKDRVSAGKADAEVKAAQAKKAANIKAHGKVAELFYQYDEDASGALDKGEVLEFCSSLGLKFTPEQACSALDEMEMEETRDGLVSLEEFVNWWKSDSTTKAEGSIAGQLAEARDKAFASELQAGTPMGKLLAAKQEAAAKADEAAEKASAKTGIDKAAMGAAAGAAAGVAGGMAMGKSGKLGKMANKAKKGQKIAEGVPDVKAKAAKVQEQGKSLKGMNDLANSVGISKDQKMKMGKSLMKGK